MDAVNFKNGQKNNWRRQAWNIVADLVAERSRALVLYLPGSTDLDRSVACGKRGKGFRSANMVAIERDARICSALRKRGATVIRGDLSDAMMSFGDDHRIGVVIADLQCGFSNYVHRLLHIYLRHPAFDGAVLLLNMQRGRDPSQYLESAKSYLAANPVLPRLQAVCPDELSFHRIAQCRPAEAARVAMVYDYIVAMEDTDDQTANIRAILTAREELSCAQNAMHADVCARTAAATERALHTLKQLLAETGQRLRFIPLSSYRSSAASPFFDSVCVRYRSFTRREPWPHERPLKRDVAAALAIRTRRLRGELRAA